MTYGTIAIMSYSFNRLEEYFYLEPKLAKKAYAISEFCEVDIYLENNGILHDLESEMRATIIALQKEGGIWHNIYINNVKTTE